jgi:N-acetylmuramic acid 6-phosphate etherase
MNEALGRLPTERVDDRYAAIDTTSVADLATLMNEADMTVPAAVRAALPQIVAAIDAVIDGLARGGRLIYVGAGSAGRLGILDAAECPPTFNTPHGLVQAVIAGGDGALALAVEGAEDDVPAGDRAVADHGITGADVVVGISASGHTPFVLAAVRAAAHVGAVTIGLSCNTMTPLSAVVSHPIEVPVGPEVVAGSTRLKAGTAQKLVLNMISTIAMVRLGKTYGNLMVDLRVTNAKLRHRAVRIIQRVTGAPWEAAEEALDAAGLDVKTAIVTIGASCDVADARRRLAAAGGRLREALAAGGTVR